MAAARLPATGTIDDARHSVLGRARPLSQTGIDSFLAGEAEARASGLAGSRGLLPASEFGHYEVLEVEAKSALTECRLPGDTWSLNPYTGCSHACAYCYVPDVARVERPRWGSYVIVKRNLPRLLARELLRKPRKAVFMSSATDPYQPAEGEHLVTRRCVELLLRADWPLRVLTRNPLVRRDIPLLTQFNDLAVGMSVPTLDDEARRLLEPGAPSIAGRLRTLRALADAGLEPYANLAPAYPLTGGVKPDDVAEAFREAGVRYVHVGAWRYLAGVLPVIRPLLEQAAKDTGSEAIERFAEAAADPNHHARFMRSLKGAFDRAGVELAGM